MVEEGKISADDAQKLISEINLSTGSGKTSFEHEKKENSISDMISHVIGSALGTAETAIRNATDSINGMFGNHVENIPVNGRNIVIVSAGSNLDLISEDRVDMHLNINGLRPKIMSSDDEIKVKVTAASGKIVLPRNSTVKLKLDGSNCDIEAEGGHYIVNSAGSDIRFDAAKGINNMKGRFTACKLELVLNKNCSTRINSKSGTVKYPEDEISCSESGSEVIYGEAPFVIDIDCTAGMCDLKRPDPVKAQESGGNPEKSLGKTLKEDKQKTGKKTIKID